MLNIIVAKPFSNAANQYCKNYLPVEGLSHIGVKFNNAGNLTTLPQRPVIVFLGDSIPNNCFLWQDEYGTVAYKTVELDTFLDDAAIQHREVQGHESSLFKSYFSGGIT